MHLLEAGVEVNVIRAWLGHASLETTNRYAEIALRTKQAFLEKWTVPSAADERIPWKPFSQTDRCGSNESACEPRAPALEAGAA